MTGNNIKPIIVVLSPRDIENIGEGEANIIVKFGDKGSFTDLDPDEKSHIIFHGHSDPSLGESKLPPEVFLAQLEKLGFPFSDVKKIEFVGCPANYPIEFKTHLKNSKNKVQQDLEVSIRHISTPADTKRIFIGLDLRPEQLIATPKEILTTTITPQQPTIAPAPTSAPSPAATPSESQGASEQEKKTHIGPSRS